MMELFHRPVDPGVGYWGERTSAVDWCESNYTWSYYIAEFFNTVTSLPAAFLALHGIYLAYKYGYERRMVAINLLVGLVGLGSAAFHGTLLYTGQIFDELPMVYASLSILYAVMEMESREGKSTYKNSSTLIIGFCLVFTGVYLYLPTFFIFFLFAYIFSILALIYLCSKIYRRPTTAPHQKLFILLAIGFYVGGWLVFWIPEIAFCDSIQSLNFHAWWHVTSTLGAFVMTLFTVYERESFRGRKPQLNYNNFLGVPILPYIHIPSSIELESNNNKKEDNSNIVNNSSLVNKVLRKKSSLSNTR